MASICCSPPKVARQASSTLTEDRKRENQRSVPPRLSLTLQRQVLLNAQIREIRRPSIT